MSNICTSTRKSPYSQKNKLLTKTFALFKLDPILIDGLLKVTGRLGNAELASDLKHSIILPKASHLTVLIVKATHCGSVGHAGVNLTVNSVCHRYWIINAKVCVKRAIDKCISCKKIDSGSNNQVMADLLSSRLRLHETPFSQVSTDYFRHLSVKLKRLEVKGYGWLFTCLTTRAIHLEVAIDLSKSSFVNVLSRFVSKRGLVKCVFSSKGIWLCSFDGTTFWRNLLKVESSTDLPVSTTNECSMDFQSSQCQPHRRCLRTHESN